MKNLFENFGSKKFNTKNLKLMLKRAYEKYRGANSSFWVTSLSFYTILAIVPILAMSSFSHLMKAITSTQSHLTASFTMARYQ